MDSQKKKCPESGTIELLILQKLTRQTDQKIEHHLRECAICKKLFSELRAFYNLFNDQLKRPVANSVFRLIGDIEKDNVIIAAILLKPILLDEKIGERHYTSEIIISTKDFGATGLDDLDCIPLSSDEILIRAIQSTHTQETTLFLYSENKKLYSDVTLKIPQTEETFKSNEKGKIEFGQLDIENLDNREIVIISRI